MATEKTFKALSAAVDLLEAAEKEAAAARKARNKAIRAFLADDEGPVRNSVSRTASLTMMSRQGVIKIRDAEGAGDASP